MAKKRLPPEPNATSAVIEWYNKALPVYVGLAESVRAILDSQLKSAEIDFLSVTARAKTPESLEEKIRRKTYKDPRKEVHDLAGIRVITYIESEAKRVAKIIGQLFKVHALDTLDKSSELGVDRMGYRSMHFVCDLGTARCKLPEFAHYKSLPFEVQVRTVLQHAWAEIEHDRNYKFTGLLPTELQRRFNLAAGMLEMVDREFDTLGAEIDRYAAVVARKTDAGDLAIEVNTTSLLEYLRSDRFNEKGFEKGLIKAQKDIEWVVPEVRRFGLTSLAELDDLFTESLVKAMNAFAPGTSSYTGVLRTAMLWKDIDLYFSRAWKKGVSWNKMPAYAYSLFHSKYGSRKMNALLRRHGIRVEEEAHARRRIQKLRKSRSGQHKQ